jgi:hypothetical protein
MRYLIMALICLGASTVALGQQPVQWSPSSGGNGNWYLAVEGGQSLNRDQLRSVVAATLFRGEPGHLVTIANAAENAFVFSLLNMNHGWTTGAIQSPSGPEPSGGWGWETGEPWTYSNWCSAEPNDADGAEDCMCFADWGRCPGGWNDQICSATAGGYIVEWEADVVATDDRRWGSIKAMYQ